MPFFHSRFRSQESAAKPLAQVSTEPFYSPFKFVLRRIICCADARWLQRPGACRTKGPEAFKVAAQDKAVRLLSSG